MKKIYLSLLAAGLFNVSQAQTLTAAANEPTVGDIYTYKKYDSVGVVPKNTGAGQNWSFASFTLNPAAATVKNYTTPASVPESTLFTGCTLVETQAGSDNLFWKSVSSPTPQFELLGINNPGANSTIQFTNSVIAVQWPVAMGYSVTDVASGTATLGASGTADMVLTREGTGTGTLVIPGGTTFTDILQTRALQTLTLAFSTLTLNIQGTDYEYYHSSQKFSMLTVSYESQTLTPSAGSPTITTSAVIKVNNNLITGINEKNFDATFQIFPNPAKESFNVNLNNSLNNDGIIEIFDNMGRLVKSVTLGNGSIIQKNISIEGMDHGIYHVRTTLGNRVSNRKLIIE